MSRPTTFGTLKESGYRPRSVKDEIRANLIARIRSGEKLFPGIVGYEHTVEPQIVNALLSRHDFILLGLRGQAKTRLLRALAGFLDEWIPVVAGDPLNSDPFLPLTHPLTSAFAHHMNGGLRLQDNLVEAQADELGDTKPCREGEVQHGSIADAVA